VREIWADEGCIYFLDAQGRDSEVRGIGRIIEVMEAAWATGPMERHIVSNPAISVTGDEAEARYYTLYSMPSATPVAPSFGEHRVKARKIDGRWRMVEHHAIQYARPEGSRRG